MTMGSVRMVKNRPPGPPFSPSVWRIPNFLGTSKSSFHSAQRSTQMELTTKPAPGSASRRFSVFSILRPAPLTRFISTAMAYMRSNASASMSTRVNVLPVSSRLENTSRNMARPKLMLPAPMKTILVIALPPICCSP